MSLGNSLVVQWLRLCAPDTGGLGLIPGQGTRSHMPQLRLYAAKLIKINVRKKKVHSLKKKKKKERKHVPHNPSLSSMSHKIHLQAKCAKNLISLFGTNASPNPMLTMDIKAIISPKGFWDDGRFPVLVTLVLPSAQLQHGITMEILQSCSILMNHQSVMITSKKEEKLPLFN